MLDRNALDRDIDRLDADIERVAKAKTAFARAVNLLASDLALELGGIGELDLAAFRGYLDDGVGDMFCDLETKLQRERTDLLNSMERAA